MENDSNIRSEWQLWLPLLLSFVLAAYSWSGLIAVVIWISVGFAVVRIKRGRKLATYGNPQYRHGIRKGALVWYHLCWWPSYFK